MSQRTTVIAVLAFVAVALCAFATAVGLFLSSALAARAERSHPTPIDARRPGPKRPGKLLLMGFAGTDRARLAELAEGLGAELRLEVEVVAEAPEPTIRGRRDGSYQGEALRLQIGEALAHRGDDRSIHGVIALTEHPIHAVGYPWVYGCGGPGAAVLSTARFADPDREVVAARTLKQALSSASRVLDLPRCKNRACAGAFPRNLEEHDAKSPALCEACQRGIDRAVR